MKEEVVISILILIIIVRIIMQSIREKTQGFLDAKEMIMIRIEIITPEKIIRF